LLSRQVNCTSDSSDKAAGISLACARQVEGSAMVNRRADHWEAEGNVNGIAEGGMLDD
tara:strand:+ start:785 stop:958 length:174 start_codon:yes stop_codon:yes gene_type:complete